MVHMSTYVNDSYWQACIFWQREYVKDHKFLCRDQCTVPSHKYTYFHSFGAADQSTAKKLQKKNLKISRYLMQIIVQWWCLTSLLSIKFINHNPNCKSKQKNYKNHQRVWPPSAAQTSLILSGKDATNDSSLL